MTKSLATRLAERAPAPRAPRTIYGKIADRLDADRGMHSGWPKVQYQKDPVGFARDVLGYAPCTDLAAVRAEIKSARADNRKAKVLWWKQIELLEALVDDNASVAVKAGQKTSKTKTAGIAALWFFGSFPGARVLLTATKATQIERYIWREILEEIRDAEEPIPGEIAQKAATGIRGSGGREISGSTATKSEAMQGFSGANQLVIADEATGIIDQVFEAIEGNRAGGGRLLMLSNPTRTAGFFFDAFTKRRAAWKTLTLRSDETPNVVAGEMLIPGVAGPEWIARQKEQFGEAHPFYVVRVTGEFVMYDDARIVSLHTIEESQKRWQELEDAGIVAMGRIHIGFDPAGPGSGGDESVFVVRRGLRVVAIYKFRGKTENALLVQLLGIIATHRTKTDEPPVVILDRSGPIGVKIGRLIAAYLDDHENDFELVQVISSDRSTNAVVRCDRIRDELWLRLAEWFRDGGAIPEDAALAKELHAPKWFTPPGKDVIKATPKDELRKELDGRSPDTADALALSVWEGRDGEAVDAARKISADPYTAPATDAYEPDAVTREDDGDQVYGDGAREQVYGD